MSPPSLPFIFSGECLRKAGLEILIRLTTYTSQLGSIAANTHTTRSNPNTYKELENQKYRDRDVAGGRVQKVYI